MTLFWSNFMLKDNSTENIYLFDHIEVEYYIFVSLLQFYATKNGWKKENWTVSGDTAALN